MDWRVTARTGKPHTKLYQEERERPIMLLVDFSPSMFFGTRRAFKSVVAAETAGLLAWATMTGGDRVGGVIAGAGVHYALNPTAGRRGVLRFLGALAAGAKLGPMPGAPGPGLLRESCRRLRQITRPGSAVFVISDHYELDDQLRAHLAQVRAQGSLTGIWIHDPLEETPPPPGRYPVTDGTNRAILDAGSESVRHSYVEFFASRREAVRQLYGQFRAKLLEISTAQDVESALRDGLGTGPRPLRDGSNG